MKPYIDAWNGVAEERKKEKKGLDLTPRNCSDITIAILLIITSTYISVATITQTIEWGRMLWKLFTR